MTESSETNSQPIRRKSGGRVFRVSVAVLVLAGGAYWGKGWVEHRSNHIFENDARIAADMISVSSRVGGWVVRFPVGQGDRVAVGDQIVRIDSREAAGKLDEMKARIAEIKAEQAKVETEIRMTENQTRHRLSAQGHRVSAARAAVDTVRAHLKLMESEYQRMKSLAGQRIVSQQRLDKANAELRGAQEDKRRAEAELASHRAVLSEIRATGGQADVYRKQIVRLQAEEKRAVARYDQQRLNVEDRTILSPISGVVDKTFADLGEYVRPGQRLALIHNPEKIWVDANIRETELREVSIGASVRIFVDAFPDQVFTGEVIRVGNAATNQFSLLPNPNPSGNFTKISQRIPIKIQIKQEGGNLRPGMMVEIEIATSKRPKPNT